MRKGTQYALSRREINNSNGSGKTFVQAYCFAGPLFPDHIQLLLDLSAHTAILVRLCEGGAVSLLRSRLLTPSGAKVFLALLQAYPKYCEFASLFACLDLPQLEEERVFGGHGTDWEMLVRPVRRAIASLTPALSAFGLQLHSLRNKGYLLVLDEEALFALSSEQTVPQTESRVSASCRPDVPTRRKPLA
jgi:hypothetical protein